MPRRMKRLNTGNDREDWNVEAGMLMENVSSLTSVGKRQGHKQ